MSNSSATDFIKKIGEDHQLYDKIHRTLGDFGQVELVDAVGQKVVKIGQDNGFNFSVDEIKDAFSDFRHRELSTTQGELDEAQLESVVGGTNYDSKGNPLPAPKPPPVYSRLNPNDPVHIPKLGG